MACAGRKRNRRGNNSREKSLQISYNSKDSFSIVFYRSTGQKVGFTSFKGVVNTVSVTSFERLQSCSDLDDST